VIGKEMQDTGQDEPQDEVKELLENVKEAIEESKTEAGLEMCSTPKKEENSKQKEESQKLIEGNIQHNSQIFLKGHSHEVNSSFGSEQSIFDYELSQ
jgi:hypothetical protein